MGRNAGFSLARTGLQVDFYCVSYNPKSCEQSASFVAINQYSPVYMHYVTSNQLFSNCIHFIMSLFSGLKAVESVRMGVRMVMTSDYNGFNGQ
jgi:hypothetical protein